MSNIGRETVKNTLFEFQTDALSAVDTANAHIEGDDVTSYEAVTPTVRMQNYCQISRKTLVLADTEEDVDKAGRKSELSYQIAKKGAELKRDMESIMLNNQAASAGNTSTARKTASILAWIKTNTDKGTGGGDPSYTTLPNAARTDSTAGNLRSFTEIILKNVVQKVWSQGGKPKMLMVGPVNKQRASTFAGIADSRYNVNGAKPSVIIGAADIYVSDFGNIDIVPNRFQRERDALVIDPEYASMVTLRNFRVVKLAKTGDAEKRMMLAEWGLKVHTELAHGLAADLTTT